MKQKSKLIIVLVVEFLAIAAMLVLIFFAGKRSYTVTFDLNGGTLLSGETIQRVTQGQNASPPTVAKDGCYFLQWSGSYRQVTKDLVLKAVWEYETTPGIDYVSTEDSNYCEIVSCYPGLTGEVYIGAYHNDKKVLGIREGAFAGCEGITSVYLLDGIIEIGNGAFSGCTNLKTIELPSTLTRLGEGVFEDCINLETVKLPENLVEIGDNAFAGCQSLTKIILPKSLQVMGVKVFDTAGLVICAYIKQEEKPLDWAYNWRSGVTEMVWEYVEEPEEETSDDKR